MADLQNPKAILKLWKKANEKHGFGNDVQTTAAAKTKPAAADVKRVVKKLTNLHHATADLPIDSEPKKEKFDRSKDVALKSLQKCCRTFKSKTGTTGEVKDFNKMRKAVLQVTKVVSQLKAEQVEDKDVEPQLTALDDIKTDDLEEALKDDNFGKFQDSELDHDDEPVTVTPVQDKKPVQSSVQLEYEKKLQQLEERRQQALQTPLKDMVEKLFVLAAKNAQKGLHAEALSALEKFEKMDLKNVPEVPTGVPPKKVPQPHGPSSEQLEYKNMLTRLMDRITEAKSAPAPTGTIVSGMFDEARNHASKLQFRDAVNTMKRLEQKLDSVRDAHGNVRELANKEDAMVNKFIKTVLESPPVVKFQKKKFGDRMNGVAGKIPGVNWEDMIGTGSESDPFDVISQINPFKEGATDEFDVGSKKSKISYLNFQDALYGDEFESRAKLVMALASQKRKTLSEKEQTEKLDTLVNTLKEKWQVVKTKEEANKKDSNNPRPSQQEMTELKSAINDAFTFVGFKGVSEDVQSTRDQIKNGLFLGKDNAFLSRGRKPHTGTEKGRGIGSDDDGGSHKVHDSGRKVFMGKNVNIRDDDTPASNVFRELGIPFTGGASGSTVDAVGGIVDDVVMGNEEDKKHLADLVKLQKEKDQIVTDLAKKKEEELVRLVREKEELLERKPVDQEKVSEIEKKLEETDAQFNKEIEEKTAEVNTKIEQEEDAVRLKPEDPRLGQSEAEICMYIMGMHSAGHHSIVEMLYAAKQYPQKFFRTVRDPITEYNELQQKRLKFYESNPLSKFQNPEGMPQLDNGALFKKQQEAMLKECPDKITSHDECVKEFMKYAAGAIKNV